MAERPFPRQDQPKPVRYLFLSILVFAMLPAQAANYRIGLCLFGCPSGTDPGNQLILRPIYALSYNSTTRVADWVSYKVSADSIGIASALSREPKPDPYVPDTLQAADFILPEDSNLLRSQLVPLVSFAGTPYWDDVNFMTAQVARTRSLNQGPWYGLEWAVRNLVNRESEVYVIAGPVYYPEPVMEPLPTATPNRVPDAFFKIIVTESGRGTVFLLPQDSAIHVHHCETRSSLEEIEALTGLLFFPERPGLTLEPLDQALGCF